MKYVQYSELLLNKLSSQQRENQIILGNFAKEILITFTYSTYLLNTISSVIGI